MGKHTPLADHRAAYGFREQFLKALAKRLPHPYDARTRALEQIRDRTEVLFNKYQERLSDKPSALFLAMSGTVLASYQVLRCDLEDAALIAMLRDTFIAQGQRWISRISNLLLWLAPDRMQLAVNASRWAEKQYGDTFNFEHEGDGHTFYEWNVTRCFFHEVLSDAGEPHLTTIFCAWDASWYRPINPERHGVRFELPTTLARGHDRCRFQFYKVDTSGG